MNKARMRIIKTIGLILAFELLLICASAQELKPEIVFQSGHSNYVKSVVFSKDGRLIASGGLDGKIKIWESETGFEVRSIKAAQYSVSSIAFSPDNSIVASGQSNGTIALWNVKNGNAIKTFSNSPIEINSIKFSSDGKLLAAGGYEKITLWNVESGQEFKVIEGPKFKKFTTVDFSSNNDLLAGRNEDGTAGIWDVHSGQLLKNFKEQKYISTVAFSPDGKVLAGNVDLNLKFWDVATGQEIKTIKLSNWGVTSLTFSPDGATLAGGSSGSFRVWHWREGHELKKLKGDEFSAIAFYPDGKILASDIDGFTVNIWDVSSGQIIWNLKSRTSEGELFAVSPDSKLIASAVNSKIIKLVDLQSGQLLETITGHKNDITAIVFSPDSNFLATGSLDKTIKIWDVKSGLEIKSFNGHSGYVSGLAFSSNGEILASSSFDKTVKLWNTAKGMEIKTIKVQELNQNGAYIGALEFSPDNKILAGESNGVFKNSELDNKIIIWDVETGNKLKVFKGNSTSIAFSTNGKTIASADITGKVDLWDLENGSPLKTLKREISIDGEVFSPDGTTIAIVGKDNKIRLWNVEKEQVVKVLEGHAKSIKALAFSSDGERIASGSNDKTVKIWNTLSGNLITTLKGHIHGISAVAFSADGTTLAGESEHGTIHIWNAETGQVINSIEDPYLHSTFDASLVFSPDGKVLASSRGKDTNKDFTNDVFPINLWSVADGKLIKTFTGHNSPVTSLVFSPSGKILASNGAFDKTVKLWDIETGQTLKNLKNDTSATRAIAFSPDGAMIARSDIIMSNTTVWNVENGELLRTFSGKGMAIAFSADSKKLNVAYQNFKQFDLSSSQLVKQNELNRVTIRSVKFINNDTQIAGLGENGEIILWNASDGQELPGNNLSDSLKNLRTENEQLLNINNKTFRIRFEGSSIDLFDIFKTKLASIISISETDWLVLTPEGLFDGSPGSWKQLIWRFDNNTFNYAPVEAFFKEFYYPGLLQEILQGKTPTPPAKDLSEIDIRQPAVKITEIEGKPINSANNLSADKQSVKIRVEIEDNSKEGRKPKFPASSGANDLRLFRNGSLVRLWKKRGTLSDKTSSVFDLTKDDGCTQVEATKDTPRKAVCETEVAITAGENKFTAYAFNHEDVKSNDATASVEGKFQKRDGTIYVLAIGVNKYANSGYNLNFAVPDVVDIGNAIKQEQDKLAQDANRKQYAKTEIITLKDETATKENILTALNRFSKTGASASLPENLCAGLSDNLCRELKAELGKIKPTEPEDALIVYYAGHGVSRGERFYLLPHNFTGAGGEKSLAEQAISDVELNDYSEKIDAGKLLMVIDACQSGGALGAKDAGRAPMNSKGLAQLAYDKGMYILTAAQSHEAALEAVKIGDKKIEHGLLTYALLEAIKVAPQADRDANAQLWEREWFDYAVEQVPLLQREAMQRRNTEIQKTGRGAEIVYVNGDQNKNPNERKVQTPRVFYRRETDINPFIVAKP